MESLLYAGITAPATSLSAWYAALAHRLKMTPPIRSEVLEVREGCVIVHLRIFPAARHVRMSAISSNAGGVALVERIPGGVFGAPPQYEVHGAHSRKVPVDVDLLPSGIAPSGEWADVYLSIKLRKSKSTVRISFHMVSSLFPVRHRITTVNSTKTE